MDKFENYWKLSEMEERFNSSSGSIRALASAWILASLGAIGWLFNSYEFDSWPMPLGLIVVMVSSLSTIGITILWVMDLLVFHRLLQSVFLVGLKMENDDSELPPIRSMMMKTQEGSGTSKWEFLFYLSPMIFFVSLSIFLIAFGEDKLFLANEELFELQGRLASWVFLVIQLIFLSWVFKKNKSMTSYRIRASWFRDQEFTNMVSQKSYDSIIKNYNK